ncbi:hypothetical protein [Natrialba aegyptia]|uniref:VOC domain-containing protein n=1 Tax=Natrialba aegyptia DSM 13077 TaxID=1227491 RepID=M0BB87_9EURY|nr:hypothetical protein [Natrialba aegyptia]ELZ06924.1 hypothetical protein C480_07862 [Natrialba aegyptia DSM 13077]
MDGPTLFHLHFNTPDVESAAERLEREGLPCTRRFGTVRGENRSFGPEDDVPDEFRFKLQVHRRGNVDITLAPGKRPRIDHLGLRSSDFDGALERARARGSSVRQNSRRTFVMTPWTFRMELHPRADEDRGAAERSESDDTVYRIEDALLSVPDADAVRTYFDTVFGAVPQLAIESGGEIWLESFTVATDRKQRRIDVAELLGA